MGVYDIAQVDRNVFFGNWSLGQFLFLLNNIEQIFNIKLEEII